MARITHPGHIDINPSEVSEARYFQSWDLPDALAFPDHIGPVLEAWKSAAAESLPLKEEHHKSVLEAWKSAAAERGSTVVEPKTSH